MELRIVKNYKEHLLYKTADYERMLTFEVDLKSIDEKRENIHSFYYMDNRDNFWLTVEFVETILKIELTSASHIFNHKPTSNFEEVKMVLISKDEISIFTELVCDKYLSSILHIIFSNSRQGAPRKNITFENRIYNIKSSYMDTTKVWKIIQ